MNRRFRRRLASGPLSRLDSGTWLHHDKFGTVRTCETYPDPGGDSLFGYSLLDENGCMKPMEPVQEFLWGPLPCAPRNDRATANGWKLSTVVVAAGRRCLSAEPEPVDTADDHGDLDGDPPGSLIVTSPAAPHGPPAPWVSAAA